VVTSLAHGRALAGLAPTEVVAGLVAAVVAWRTRNLAWTVVAGVGAVAVLRLLG
jgi:branched-subunit amino acid transport protein